MKVGKTLYLLSEGGRQSEMKANKGGKILPTIPIFGNVCLAVGELYFSLFNAVRQKKKIMFFMLMQLSPAEAEVVNYYSLQSEVIILQPKQKVGKVVSIMKIENSFGEVLLIVSFIASIFSAIWPIFFDYGFRSAILQRTRWKMERIIDLFSLVNNQFTIIKNQIDRPFLNSTISFLKMRKSKSCEDIRVHIKRQHDAINVNSNALVSKLMKRSPCRKTDQKDQYDAYHWATLCNQKANYGNSIKDIEIVSYRKGNMKRAYSQEDLERLLNIQDELKVIAFQNICSKVSMKSRVPLKVTPKELAKLDDNTLKSRMKRSQVVKKVMMNTTQNLQKVKYKKKKEENSSYQSNHSITNTTIETFKGSFQQESAQQKTIKLEKTHKFEKRLNKIDYNEVYNTERRKQAWKAYHEAERNKIIMMKPENCRKALITFINDSSNNGKPKKRNHKTMENEEGDGGFDTLRAFKEINQNFQDFSSNYKLSLK